MRDALRDEMIKKICVRDTDNILDVGCGDGTFLHELTPVSYTHLTLPTKRIV